MDKPLSDYHLSKKSSNGRQHACKTCCKARDKQRYQAKRATFASYYEGRVASLADVIPPSVKQCSRCLLVLSAAEFHASPNSSDRLKSYCIPCDKLHQILRLYKLTQDQYEAMLALGCGICGVLTDLHVDHDHACCPGQRSCGACVRGVLCRRHNQALGKFRDNIDDLLAAVEYLQRETP